VLVLLLLDPLLDEPEFDAVLPHAAIDRAIAPAINNDTTFFAFIKVLLLNLYQPPLLLRPLIKVKGLPLVGGNIQRPR